MSQIEAFNQEIQENMKPPRMTGEGNQLTAIRQCYIDNETAMQMENLKVDQNTPSFRFWQYVVTLEDKYKRKPQLPHEPTE